MYKSLDNPPGRAIISGIGGLNEKICLYVVHYLQPFVLQLPSYVRDSVHLMEQVETVEVDNQALLVTLDMESLYTIIDHQVGIHAVSYFLDAQTDSDRKPDSLIIDLLEFTLRHNYFIFYCTFYLQISRTAMGVQCAPSYASLFLGLVGGDHCVPHGRVPYICLRVVPVYR